MINIYQPVSVILELYPLIFEDKIPVGTEIGRAIVNGGQSPYTYEAVNDIGAPSQIYIMDGDRLKTSTEITLTNIEPVAVKVTESPIQPVTMVLSEEPTQDTQERLTESIRIPETISLASTPSIRAVSDIQELFTKSDMIYKITRNIDLGGGTLNIPSDTVLDFQGGKFINGVLSGWVNIKDCNYKIFDNITFAPNTYIPYVKPEYFGAIGNGTIDSLGAIQQMLNSVIASAPTYSYAGSNYKDLMSTSFIFHGKYLITNEILVSTPIYGLVIDGLNLTMNETIPYVINLSSNVTKLKLINCDIDLNFKGETGIYIHGAELKDSVIRGCFIHKFTVAGINLSPTQNGFSNRILNSSVYQVEDYFSDIPSTVSEGDGLIIGTVVAQSIIDSVNFGICITNHIDDSGLLNTFSKCTFIGSKDVVDGTIPNVIVGLKGTLINSQFSNTRVQLVGTNTILGNIFEMTNLGGGTQFILCGSAKGRHKTTLIRDNYFSYTGILGTSGSPIMYKPRVGDPVIIDFQVSIIDNRYSNTMEQSPVLSNIVKDAMIKLVEYPESST